MERLVFPKEDNKLAIKRKNSITEVRFLELENDSEWGVMGDYFFIQHLIGKTPRSFLIKDATYAKTMQQVFNQIWRIADK